MKNIQRSAATTYPRVGRQISNNLKLQKILDTTNQLQISRYVGLSAECKSSINVEGSFSCGVNKQDFIYYG